ncbi:MAG: hypothetical protein R2729_19340 [Bryobacteraceae bacterium]
MAAALMAATSGCGNAQTVMNPNNPILGITQLREIAGRTASRSLPDEAAETFPVITEAGGGARVRIVFYTETGPPNARQVHPPHHVMDLDPTTGQVLRFERCQPRDIGIATPAQPVPGVAYDASDGIEGFARRTGRFFEISPAVWRLFLNRGAPLDAGGKALVAEYWDLFSRITKADVAPFYIGAAADFFGWVRSSAAK